MSIESTKDLLRMKEVSEAVGTTLRLMREYAQPGMSTFELDAYGGKILAGFDAKSAPRLTYGFPGWTCISVNKEVAHGLPSRNTILKEGDLVNIDVSAELNGYWSDNGGSFVLGEDTHQHSRLVNASRKILATAIQNISGGVKIAEIGRLIETEAKKSGYRVIKNLVGHGIGKSLHEAPEEIPCYYDPFNRGRFRKNSIVAIETFISTGATHAHTAPDGWTLTTKEGSYVAQHEHTIMITDTTPLILTEANQIWG
jgi:methionyl aminopeptidase